MKKIRALLSKRSFYLLFLLLPFLLHAQHQVDFDALDRYIAAGVKDFDAPALTIAIVKDGKVVFKKAYGSKDCSNGDPVTCDSLFNIASCSKAFTAACLGILVEEGKLKWNDKVIDYLPGFKLSDSYITKELTVTDLLCHRSGLETFGGDLLWYETCYDNAEIIKRLRYLPIKRQFRSEYGYQNNMYIVAGQVIKKASGKSWGEFLTEKILLPLNMKTTRVSGRDLAKSMDIAYPHIGKKKYPRWINKPNPAASLFSSVSEMTNWMNMLLNKGQWQDRQILKQKTIDDLFSPRIMHKVSTSQKEMGVQFSGYGLGWGVSDYHGEKIVEHSGGMPGYLSKVTLVPGKNLGIVSLTNNMNALTTVLRNKVLDIFLEIENPRDWAKEYLEKKEKSAKRLQSDREERAKQRVKRTKPSLKPGAYAGLFEDRVYGKAEIVERKGRLILMLLPTKEVFTSPMEHWHYDTFKVSFKDDFLPDGFVTFAFDSHGKVTGFKIDLPNPDFHFKNLDFIKIK